MNLSVLKPNKMGIIKKMLTLLAIVSFNALSAQLSDDPNPATDVPYDPTAGGTIPSSCPSPNFTVSTVTPAPGCAGNSTGSENPDGWILMVIPASGQLFVSPTGTGDPGMAAYTYNPTSNTYTQVGCNDDGGAGLMPQLTISGAAGTLVYLQIWMYSGAASVSCFDINSSDCATPQNYAPDLDGDGFGDASNVVSTCTPPAGYILNTGDCDDNCASIYVGAPCDDGNPSTTGEVVNSSCNCAVPATNACIGTQSITFQVVGSGNPPSSTTAGIVNGDNVEICYSLDYSNASGDWLDGMSITLGNGWSTPTPSQTPVECGAAGPGAWIWQTSISPTGGSATPAGYGYYYDYNLNGNGGDDWGDSGAGGTGCIMSFCVTATAVNVAGNISVGVSSGGDSVYGSFTSTSGCPLSNFTYTPPTPGGCNLALFGCITPSLCDDDDSTPLQNGWHTIGGKIYFSGTGLGNLVVMSGTTQLLNIPAPAASPYTFNIPAYSDGASHTVQFYFDSNPTCVVTGTYQSPDPCGCLLDAAVTAFTCQPMPPAGTDPVYYDISLDINNANLPFGSALNIDYECGGGNVVNINSLADIATLNASTYNFGIFGPISGLAPGTNSDGFCDITFSLTDITTGAIIPCVFPDPVVQVEVPMVDVQNFTEIPNSCAVTTTGSTNDVQFDLNVIGANTVNATNIYFFMDGAPVSVSVSGIGGPFATSFPISVVPASNIVSVTVMDVPATSDHDFSFSLLSSAGCTFDSPVISAANPATPYLPSFAYTNPTQCQCSISNLTVTNLSDCLGYSNIFTMGVQMDISNVPAGAGFNLSFSPIPGGGSQNIGLGAFVPSNGNVTQPNLSVSIPPTVGGVTAAFTATLLAEFTGVATPCQATVTFVVPGDCSCNADAGTFSTSIASTTVAGQNQIVVCAAGSTLSWNSNDNFIAPAPAYALNASNAPVLKPHQRALGLVFYDLNNPAQQVLWDIADIDFTAAVPTVPNLDLLYDAGFVSANQIANALNLTSVVGDEPLIFGAKIITLYNGGNLGALPLDISSYYDAANSSYLPPLYETGFGLNFTPLVSAPCGDESASWTIVLPPPITTAQVGQDCLNGLMIFQAESGSYPFTWNISSDNPANATLDATQSDMNNDASTTYNGTNYSGGFFVYGGMVTGNALSVNITDDYGCPATFTSTAFVGPTQGIVGQINNSITSPAATVPGQIVRCASNDPADNLHFVGLGQGLGNTSIPGTWNISWNGNLLTTPLNAYFDNTTGTFVPSYDLINTNPGVAPYLNYMELSFTPTIALPGCSIESQHIQVAILDDYFPTVSGNLSKCTNSALVNLSANGTPAGGQWHAGTYDAATDSYSDDSAITGANLFNPLIAGAGMYDLWYDITNAPGVQCGQVAQIAVPIVVFDTTNALVTPVDPNGCTPFTFELDNTAVSAATNTNCHWYINGVEDTNGDCDGLSTTQTVPGLYDVQLIIQDENGCIDTTFYNNLLEIYPLPDVSFYSTPSSVTMDNPQFQFINSSDSPLAQLDWDFAGYGTGTGQATSFNFSGVTEPGTYEVCLDGTDLNGCLSTFCNTVIIKEGFAVFMPSAITADQDNLNEALRPVISGKERITVYLFRVFDRWGNIIFETTDYNEFWNANTNTAKDYYVSSGVYQWMMEITLEGLDDTQLFNGSVTVIR